MFKNSQTTRFREYLVSEGQVLTVSPDEVEGGLKFEVQVHISGRLVPATAIEDHFTLRSLSLFRL